jgi:hypothetical protein
MRGLAQTNRQRIDKSYHRKTQPMNTHTFDLATSLARFDAWWHGEIIDRPPVRLYIEPSRPQQPMPPAASARDGWMDPSRAVAAGLAGLAETDWLADSAPVYMPNLGPDIAGTLFGCELEFGPATSWSSHPIDSDDDYARIAESQPDFSNPYWQAIEEMTRLSLARSCEGHLTGMTDIHGSIDTLVSLRGPGELCCDLMDIPELVHRALDRLVEGNRAIFNRSRELLLAGGQDVSTSWTTCLHRGPAYVSSADFLALISPEMAQEFVRPYLRREWDMLERSVFHLDGREALRHLDWLLEEDWIQAIQWVYGAGGGRACDWLDVYRKIRAAGKSIHLIAVDADDALHAVRELGPQGLWIEIQMSRFPSVQAAEAFMENLQRIL